MCTIIGLVHNGNSSVNSMNIQGVLCTLIKPREIPTCSYIAHGERQGQETSSQIDNTRLCLRFRASMAFRVALVLCAFCIGVIAFAFSVQENHTII